jgi:hypothetical protein
MNETRYLVDNNALIAIKGERIKTPFFLDHCSITEDVLREAGDRLERVELESIVIRTSPSSLAWLRKVMSSIDAGNIGLVDLYKNKGTADPGLVAAVLDAIELDADKFFADEWVIVSDDQAVRTKSAEFGISTMAASDLAAIIDAA